MKILKGRTRPAVRFPRQKILGLAALLGVSWFVVGMLVYRGPGPAEASLASRISAADPIARAQPATAPATAPSPEITESAVGPWGKMQLVPIVIELPDEYATVTRAASAHDRWNFAGMNRDAAIAFMTSCGFTSEQLASMGAATWTDLGTSSSVEPTDDVILTLSPDTRAALYTQLMADPVNKSVIDPSWFRVDGVDFRLRGAGLSETSTAMLKRLLYASGSEGTLLFNDIKPSLRAIADPAERMRFLKAITRKRSLMARLSIDPGSDTTALAQYWGHGGREKDLVPLLDSLKFNAMSGVENPSRINIATLLPSFVQERLYRHADTQTEGRTQEDCFWTAFNFFSDVPDDRVQDMAYLAQVLQRDYVKIDAPGQLGDVILVANAKGDVLHAANYIADDVVFTKNGISGRQPWMLVPMSDMLRTYNIKNATLTVAYFRKR